MKKHFGCTITKEAGSEATLWLCICLWHPRGGRRLKMHHIAIPANLRAICAMIGA